MDKCDENKNIASENEQVTKEGDTMENTQNVEESEKSDDIGNVEQKYPSESVKMKEKQSVEKAQEAKLKAKFPGAKSGTSEFLKKRLSKGRVYFDSGEYNMSKTKIDNRSSTKPHSKTPTLIRSISSEKEEEKEKEKEKEESEDTTKPVYGEKDNPLPEPEETAQQAIPTPELLFLRRASLHMPMSASEAQHASMPEMSRRRYTAAPKGLVPTTESSAFPIVFEHESPPPFVSEQMSKRRATLHVPSKLTIE